MMWYCKEMEWKPQERERKTQIAQFKFERSLEGLEDTILYGPPVPSVLGTGELNLVYTALS